MRKETRTTTVQHTVQETVWTCEEPGCRFSSKDQDEASIHEASHTFKRRAQVSEEVFYFFDDFESFSTFSYENCITTRIDEEQFAAGWYLLPEDAEVLMPALEVLDQRIKTREAMDIGIQGLLALLQLDGPSDGDDAPGGG